MKRELIETLTRRKESMVNALTSNSNYDDDKGTRKQAIEEIEENYEEVVQIILHGAEEEPEIDSDNPFFKAAEKGLEKIEAPGNAGGAAAVKDVVNLEHEKYIDQV
jgi:hypothetical protein